MNAEDKAKEETEFLRPTDVALRLNISRRTVLRLLNQGQLKGTRVRKQWRIHRTHMDEFCRRLLDACAVLEAEDAA
jgi:excisionase family DNA binding protein